MISEFADIPYKISDHIVATTEPTEESIVSSDEEIITLPPEPTITIPTNSPMNMERVFLNIPKQVNMGDVNHKTEALITDIFAIPQDGQTVVHAVFSALNLIPGNSKVEYNDFTLTHGTTVVNDLKSIENHVEALRVLKFILPYVMNKSFHVDIYDAKRIFTYEHLFVQVLPTQKIGGIGVCAMISDYNIVGEVKSWIAWYKLQQITNVLLYSIKPVPEVERVIKPAIDSGFARYYQYHYPLNKYRRFEQRSIQLAVINSCFYRHRHLYDGIVPIDLDEFIHSPLNPTNLTKTFMDAINSSSGEFFRFFSTMYYLDNPSKRTQSFYEGTIFSDYVWKEPSRFSFRSKYMLRSSSEGSLSVHYCISCSYGPDLNEDKIVIHHFKLDHNNHTELTYDDSMKVFTPHMKKTMAYLTDNDFNFYN